MDLTGLFLGSKLLFFGLLKTILLCCYSVPKRVGTLPPCSTPGCTEFESESRSVVSNSLQPHGPYSAWDSPGQNTGVGSNSLLQGIFPTQGLNWGLLHCRQILYQLSHQGGPRGCLLANQQSPHINILSSFGIYPLPTKTKEKSLIFGSQAQNRKQ